VKWFRPILLLFALPLPCSAADPLPPAEAAQLRAQRKTIGQEALAKIQKKECPANPYFGAAFTLTGQWR